MKIFLIFFVLLFSSSVFAEWTILMNDVTDHNGITQDVYYNKSKMQKEDNILTLAILLDFHQQVKGVRSSVIIKTIECGPTELSTERYKLWRLVSYNQSMGRGKVTFDSGDPKEDTPWRYVGPKKNILVHIMINFICDHKR